MSDFRIICCPNCDGDGRLHTWGTHTPRCRVCEGTGQIEIEVEPIEMEDLDA